MTQHHKIITLQEAAIHYKYASQNYDDLSDAVSRQTGPEAKLGLKSLRRPLLGRCTLVNSKNTSTSFKAADRRALRRL